MFYIIYIELCMIMFKPYNNPIKYYYFVNRKVELRILFKDI